MADADFENSHFYPPQRHPKILPYSNPLTLESDY